MEFFFSKFPVRTSLPLLVHSNQHLITYYEFLQPLVKLYNRVIIIIVDCYLPCIMIM